jgi:mitotic-spindle organizing protein 1
MEIAVPQFAASKAINLMEKTRETMDLVYEMSLLLNTGLDKQTLAHCVSLLEQGVNPEALATVIKELKSKV